MNIRCSTERRSCRAGYASHVPRVDGLRMIDSESRERRRERATWTAELLDLEAGRMPFPVLDRAAIRALLAARPRIAVVGASPNPTRPSHGVLVDLLGLGYDCVPVNPSVEEVAGLRCYPTVVEAVEATGPVDIVDVFRLPPACPEHAREAVAVGARVFWLQLGIVSPEARTIAKAGGLDYVENECTAIVHRSLRPM